ncbi:MAG: hypothetical protein FWC70_06625 [Defluviitaleaceae bacterium]|nr:hypothetical protein [Defluviitaleaceae bacterium]
MKNENFNNEPKNTLRARIARKFKGISAGTLMVFSLAIAAYFAVPALATQPGTDENPIITRRVLDARIAELEAQIDDLRGSIGSGGNFQQQPSIPQITVPDLTAAGSAALMAEIMQYVELRINAIELAPGQLEFPGEMPQFVVLHKQEGQVVTFDAGTEFILRGGRAVAVTDAYNGIPDVTAGNDVFNGQPIGLNHLMMIPRTDGRGVMFTAESWMMVRGSYTVN